MEENIEKELPKAENPTTLAKLKLTKPESIAAGMEAVFGSGKHVFKEANVFRGMKALLKLNQKEASTVRPAPGPTRMMTARPWHNIAKAEPKP